MGDNWPSFPSFGLDGKPSSGISFTKGELTSAGQKLGDHVTYLQELEKRAGNLSVSFPHFGVLGMGVHSAHESAIESQREVLKRAKAALESWKRSEEHTSELQSRENLVCRLLLEKKKPTNGGESRA